MKKFHGIDLLTDKQIKNQAKVLYVFLLASFWRVDDFPGLILTSASSVNSSLLNSLVADLLLQNANDVKAAAQKCNNEEVQKRT